MPTRFNNFITVFQNRTNNRSWKITVQLIKRYLQTSEFEIC